jgi:hypothetical protein
MEKCYTRRVGEVSGASRPGNGCTRSVVYDTKRKLWWFFAGAASGPYNPAAPTAVGPYCYDPLTDLFTDLKKAGANPGNLGCIMTYDPDHDVSIVPGNGMTWVFNFATALWEQRATTGGPGTLYGYNRIAYIKSLKKFFCLNGSWQAWMYDAGTNTWEDKTTGSMPPSRGSKLGLVYDEANDVILLIGGQTGWNTGPFNDLWAYHPNNNTWENMNPASVGGLRPNDDCMMSAYDNRHNVTIVAGTDGGPILAYRYKKTGSGVLQARDAASREPRLLASPNPFCAMVTIMVRNGALYPSSKTLARITDITGKTVKVFRARDLSPLAGKDFALAWNAAGVAPGVYLLSVKFGGKEMTQRLVVE